MEYIKFTPEDSSCVCGNRKARCDDEKINNCKLSEHINENIVLDVVKLNNLNSQFLGVLLLKTLKRNKQIVMINATERIRVIVKILGIDHKIKLFDSEEEAKNYFLG